MSLIRNIELAKAHVDDTRHLLGREWLVTNGLGGYASGTISGMVTRRYHGLLIAALPAPHGRVVMLNHLAETLLLPDGRRMLIGGGEPGHSEDAASGHYVSEFRLEEGLPTWRFEAEGYVLEKRVLLIHAQNTTYISYRLLSWQDCAKLE